ncbi:MAG: hypothetical protein AAF689_12210 [Pseudomonadota bacterium]
MRAALITLLLASPAAAQDFTLDAQHAGFREYYCVTEGTLTNHGQATLQEVNGYFLLYRAGEEIGRSRGSSFLALTPGTEATARMEAPHSPCDTADEYRFVVNACMQDSRFIDRATCADMLAGTGPVTTITARE